MKISAINPETGAKFQADAEVSDDFIQSMSEIRLSDASIKKVIDELRISADAKLALHSLSSTTIRAGDHVLKIGRKIIDFICSIFREFPTASFGVIFGAIIGFLIAAIPILGIVLGPIVTPIAIALGIVLGLHEDIKDKALERKIAEINAKFSTLKTR